MRIKISARKSDLARLQAYFVAEALQKIQSSLQIEFSFRESLGDKNLTDPLWKIPQKGVFTEDFYQDLVEGTTDVVVHSWKDLATETKPDTFIVATLPRADERDVLLLKKSHQEQLKTSKKIRLFTSSPRRLFHLPNFCKNYLPFPIEDCHFESVRGNIATRVKKLIENPEIDGLIMAKAALDRLLTAPQPEFREPQKLLKQDLEQCLWTVIPLSLSPPAAAQGAIGIEIRRDRHDLISLFEKINDVKTYLEASREREILKAYGGGCHQKIGISVKSFARGLYIFTSGEHQNEVFSKKTFEAKKSHSQKSLFSGNEIFAPKSSDFFASRSINPIIPQPVNALEIVKAEHLPQLTDKNLVLWTSGLETWKKLSQKGYWVHGSQESFGENALTRPAHALGTTLVWNKATHQNKKNYVSKNLTPVLPILETYSLDEKQKFPDLSAYRCFFWRSYSLFEKAVREQPRILEAMHCAGLGQTSEFIENHLIQAGISPNLGVFLDEQHWRSSVCKTPQP